MGKAIWTTAEPLMSLRFVEKPMQVGNDNRLVRVLQQRWVITESGKDHEHDRVYHEWRDVPLEVDQ